MHPIVLFVSLLGAPFQAKDEPTDLSFVIAVSTTVHQEPSGTSPAIAKLVPGDIVMVYRATEGWLRVDLLNQTNQVGWIATKDKDGLISESWLDVRVRAGRIKDEPWPSATKVDILRRRVRVGFSERQVQAALGSPRSKESEETVGGVTSTWSYSSRLVVFKAGKVVSIKTVE